MKKGIIRKGAFLLLTLIILFSISSCAAKVKPEKQDEQQESETSLETNSKSDNSSQTDSSRTDSSRTDISQTDSSQTDSSRTEDPSESQARESGTTTTKSQVKESGTTTKPDLQNELPESTASSDEQQEVTFALLQPGIIYEDELVKISVDGLEIAQGYGYSEILFSYENKSDLTLNFSDDYIIVNGIVLNLSVFGGIVDPHTTNQASLELTTYELEKAQITDISSVEIEMTLVNDETWEDLYVLPRLTVPFKEDDRNIQPQKEERVLADNEEVRITLIKTVQNEDGIKCTMFVENKSSEEISASVSDFILNGVEIGGYGFYADIPVSCKGILEIYLSSIQLKANYNIDTLKDFSVTVNLISDSRSDYTFINDLPVYP
ncbi:MAG: hypothetical protein ACOX3H_04735 [Saccharofermentanales bacterium]|jgi:hypothetical protein